MHIWAITLSHKQGTFAYVIALNQADSLMLAGEAACNGKLFIDVMSIWVALTYLLEIGLLLAASLVFTAPSSGRTRQMEQSSASERRFGHTLSDAPT